MKGLFKQVFGSKNDRHLKRLGKIVEHINSLEPAIQSLSDEQLKQKTQLFKTMIADGKTLQEILPEAFAVVREASQRVLQMRHFDVQLIGGMVLHEGMIAEMRTGEGKTLVATLPAYLNALTGNGVHIVTVNEYLATRDAEWMGQIFTFLGLKTDVIVPGQTQERKQEAYSADIIYATNNELGFDYLRDNLAFQSTDRAQGNLSFGIVDEVDSILIDEARTPLIISGPTDENSDLYVKMDRVVPMLKQQMEEDGPGDYTVEEKTRQVFLTEAGHQHVEQLFERLSLIAAGQSLYDPANIILMHHLNAALRAHLLHFKDVHYIVRDGEVVIIDEFTGRALAGRRWSEGLHQAVEAKEGLAIQQESQTLASITFQNYFRQYKKLSGMTGTADTEAAEFQEIYNLEVIVIPTHREMVREDYSDLIFISKEEKYEAIIEDIEECSKLNKPVLVGTTSIETSEYISRLLKKRKISHEVLNAKQHEREAHIVQHAGRPGKVTIATNMAGRGTDIVLGGNLQAELEQIADQDDGKASAKIKQDWQERHTTVIESGGLHIIGTERHESRRIDNQLRGRSGRQGDPGSSRFYLSLEDDLMRIFASERVAGIMQKLGMQRGEAIEHSWVTKSIENAQRKVEGRNFDIRKELLEYDNVANDQRKEIYAFRDELMSTDDVSQQFQAIREDVIQELINQYIPPQSLDELWDIPALEQALEHELSAQLPIEKWLEQDDQLHEESLREKIVEEIAHLHDLKTEIVGEETMRMLEKSIILQVLDKNWKEHLASMDHLRQGIHLRGYAQKNPKQEYKKEAFEMFEQLSERIKQDIVSILCKMELRADSAADSVSIRQKSSSQKIRYTHEDFDKESNFRSEEQNDVVVSEAPAAVETYVRNERKIGRNEVCPCGSGKKYKHCHGIVNQ